MLADLRQALADTLAAGMPAARVVPYEPNTIDIPSSGLHVYVTPSDPWFDTWASFTTGGRGVFYYDVVITVPRSVSAAQAWRMLDDAVDPISTGQSAFAAIMATPDLGVTAFQAQAVPMKVSQQAPRPELFADAAVEVWQVVMPVEITVKRS